jgi:hypothetical protein
MAEMRAQLVATDKKITSNVSLPSHTITNSAITVPIPQRVVSASFSDSGVHNIVNNSVPVSNVQPSLSTLSNTATVPSINNFSSMFNDQLGFQNINSQFSLPGSQSMAAANATSGVNAGVTALMPSLQTLRSDPHIAAQVERMVDGISAQCAGNDYSVSLKPGLLRPGGEQAPKVKTPWPHDYVFNFGKKSGINYYELDQTQWTLGYAAIIEQESNPAIAKLMLSHLQNLMQDAHFSGFEAAKYAHGMILSQLERGRYTWFDTLVMSEFRRSAVNAKSTELREMAAAQAASSRTRQGFVQNSVSSGNSVNKSMAKNSKRFPKICAYYNNKVCSHKGDHETNGIMYIHTCKTCFRDHSEKDCDFL